MTKSSTRTADKAPTHGRGTAYHAANWHIVRAGLLLARYGSLQDAPEMRALAAALRAVNEAGGIEEPKTFRTVPEAVPQSRKEVERVFPAAAGPEAQRPGKVA